MIDIFWNNLFVEKYNVWIIKYNLVDILLKML